jgi:hypothetical protein
MDSALVVPDVRKTKKLCTRCETTKGVADFSRCLRNKDGLQVWCKACHSINLKAHTYTATIHPKSCRICELLKPASEFSLDSGKKDGLRAVCKTCDTKLRKGRWVPVIESKKALNHRKSNRPKAMLKALRQGAKKRGIRCTLVEADLAAVPIPDFCPVLGIKMEWTDGRRTINTPSIDRINPDGSYENGNWRYISWKANRLKSDCCDPAVFEAIAAYLRRHGLGSGPLTDQCP